MRGRLTAAHFLYDFGVAVLKIAFTGTHGAGKTTLAKLLATSLSLDSIVVSRPTAIAQQMGYKKAGDVPKKFFYTFQMLSLFEQIHSEKQAGQGFVSDRATVDYLAYYRHGIEFYKQTAELSKTYEDIVWRQAQTYDFLFYLPPNPNGVEDDNRRFTSEPEAVDRLIRQILAELNLPAISVPWMPESQRLAHVLEIIKG